ncbi:MAG: STELLO glycosyltransferase family protein [Gemmataceae bacterium]|nr:STELLO glycosyltransferase family protein [Gemmataceae bacterium]
MSQGWIVVTTINPPTPAIERISRLCANGWSAVVIGDTKTPKDWNSPGITYLNVEDQRRHFGALADALPYRHYCRKNLGYLYAIRHGAELILETDDDNIPYDSFGVGVSPEVGGRLVEGAGWVNIYSHFAPTSRIWPRGLPLDAINDDGRAIPLQVPVRCPIQQFLVDNDPDVDAVFRLTHRAPVYFGRDSAPAVLAPGAWTPFNSQNTLFFPEAFPLLYLPCHVSFRMTDIWRSFVAQATLHGAGSSVAFHPPTAEQIRNPHDLMLDFGDEVIGYMRNREIARVLQNVLEKAQGHGDIAPQLWNALHGIDIIPDAEMPLLDAWFKAVAVASSEAIHGESGNRSNAA